jgi:hypothetical protein
MSATHAVHSTPTAAPLLYVAFELGWTTWKMAFTIGAGQPPRIRSVPARCTSFVMSEIKKATLRFGLPANAPVVSCYEAGRDGFLDPSFPDARGDPEHRRRLRVDYGDNDGPPRRVNRAHDPVAVAMAALIFQAPNRKRLPRRDLRR